MIIKAIADALYDAGVALHRIVCAPSNSAKAAPASRNEQFANYADNASVPSIC